MDVEEWLVHASDDELALRRRSLRAHIAVNARAIAHLEGVEDMTHVRRAVSESTREAAAVDAEISRRRSS